MCSVLFLSPYSEASERIMAGYATPDRVGQCSEAVLRILSGAWLAGSGSHAQGLTNHHMWGREEIFSRGVGGGGRGLQHGTWVTCWNQLCICHLVSSLTQCGASGIGGTLVFPTLCLWLTIV